jgi:hypothetical protein
LLKRLVGRGVSDDEKKCFDLLLNSIQYIDNVLVPYSNAIAVASLSLFKITSQNDTVGTEFSVLLQRLILLTGTSQKWHSDQSNYISIPQELPQKKCYIVWNNQLVQKMLRLFQQIHKKIEGIIIDITHIDQPFQIF